MKTIQLSKGKCALVDDEVYGNLLSYKWTYSHGYAKRTEKETNRPIYLHRVITNAPKGMEVDHINGDGLDNRLCNLRVCTRAENRRNQNLRKGNKHGYKGVQYSYAPGNRFKPYRAQVRVNGIIYGSRYFATAEEAARAYDELARQHHGAYARTNENSKDYKSRNKSDRLTMGEI